MYPHTYIHHHFLKPVIKKVTLFLIIQSDIFPIVCKQRESFTPNCGYHSTIRAHMRSVPSTRNVLIFQLHSFNVREVSKLGVLNS